MCTITYMLVDPERGDPPGSWRSLHKQISFQGNYWSNARAYSSIVRNGGVRSGCVAPDSSHSNRRCEIG